MVQWRDWDWSGVSWDGEELGDPPSDLAEGASGCWLSRLSRSTPQWP